MILDIIILSIIFILVDSFYLSSMKTTFEKLVKSIQGDNLKLEILPTILCYIFLVASIYYFIIHKNGSIIDAGLLGLSIYGVFETTNLAIFKKWNCLTAIIDTLWGAILFMIVVWLFRFLDTIRRN